MIHLYHGLFGTTQDWSNIVGPFDPCLNHDLYQEPLSELLGLTTTADDILMGYSMGGRIALEIAFRNSFRLKKIILFSTHPGLDPQEIFERRIFEEDTLKKMRTLTPEKFADFWNGLPLFRSSTLRADLDQTLLEKSAELFESFMLSKTSRPYSDLKEHHSKILWITGTRDEKYKTLVQEKIQPLGIRTYETLTDHRALKDHRKIKSILLNEGIL